MSTFFKNFFRIGGSFLLTLFFVMPVLASVQTPNPTPAPAAADSPPTALINPLNASSLQELLTKVLDFAIEIGGIFLTLMIIYVGFLFVAARGNEEAISKARTALLWTVVGGLILLGAKGISLVIQNTIANL